MDGYIKHKTTLTLDPFGPAGPSNPGSPGLPFASKDNRHITNNTFYITEMLCQ